MLIHKQHFELKISEFEPFQTALGFIKESRIYWKKNLYISRSAQSKPVFFDGQL